MFPSFAQIDNTEALSLLLFPSFLQSPDGVLSERIRCGNFVVVAHKQVQHFHGGFADVDERERVSIIDFRENLQHKEFTMKSLRKITSKLPFWSILNELWRLICPEVVLTSVIVSSICLMYLQSPLMVHVLSVCLPVTRTVGVAGTTSRAIPNNTTTTAARILTAAKNVCASGESQMTFYSDSQGKCLYWTIPPVLCSPFEALSYHLTALHVDTSVHHSLYIPLESLVVPR